MTGVLAISVVVFAVIILVFIYRSPRWNIRFFLFLIKPNRPFETFKRKSAPDYSKLENWAAHPLKQDSADLVPKRSLLKNDQENAQADVFFIHFTTYYSRRAWNACLSNRITNSITDKLSIRNQASIFNESCKVYAPRYRQATLFSFFDSNDNGKKALDLAYQDVKSAFSQYLDFYNNGRPIIIAGHSQGAEHARRLLVDFFDGKELFNKLVMAYLVGMPIEATAFRGILASSTPNQTHCFAAWSVFGRNSFPNYFQEDYKKSICVNPLTWDSECPRASHRENIGSVSVSFKRIDTQVVDAECCDGILWVSRPKKRLYISLPPKNYVLMDYNLFYLNVRENVKQRVESYFKQEAE